MTDVVQPAGKARREVLRVALGAGAGVLAWMVVRASRAGGSDHVTISNFAFLPKALTVKAGTKVTWTNQDETIHTVVCPQLKLKSEPLDTNDSFSYTFQTPGTYNYACSLHPYMKGQVVVTG